MAVLTGILLASCGGNDGSTERYCNLWRTDGQELHDRYLASSSDIVSLLLTSLGAFGEVRDFYSRLADVAPEEIRSDVVATRDALASAQENQSDVLSDPAGAMAENITTAFGSSGASARVDEYTAEHCGTPRADSVTSGAARAEVPQREPDLTQTIDCNGGGLSMTVKRALTYVISIDAAYPDMLPFTVRLPGGAVALDTTLNPLEGITAFSLDLVSGTWSVFFRHGEANASPMAPTCSAIVNIYEM